MPLTQRHKKYRSPGNTISVLLIEDDPKTRLLISFHLNDPSLDVEIANNEDQATEQAASGKIDMIFTGIKPPEMDGAGLVERIRSEGLTIPVIAIIETSDRDAIINCIDSGCDGYIIKPILKKELYRVLERSLQFDSEYVKLSSDRYGN
ncbi:MAG: response regulator [Planctomycetes bacterium]|nr:response regulator [Planctomycetota bacterium]